MLLPQEISNLAAKGRECMKIGWRKRREGGKYSRVLWCNSLVEVGLFGHSLAVQMSTHPLRGRIALLIGAVKVSKYKQETLPI